MGQALTAWAVADTHWPAMLSAGAESVQRALAEPTPHRWPAQRPDHLARLDPWARGQRKPRWRHTATTRNTSAAHIKCPSHRRAMQSVLIARTVVASTYKSSMDSKASHGALFGELVHDLCGRYFTARTRCGTSPSKAAQFRRCRRRLRCRATRRLRGPLRRPRRRRRGVSR